jgi:uncharacterized protein (UPF0332 family)
MTDDQLELFESARDSLAAARLLLNGGFPGFAASRAYYAMFYIAEAFLEGKGLSFSKHSAVIAAFGQHFAHTGQVPTQFHKFLLQAQELRHSGDYGTTHSVTTEQAESTMAQAEMFLQLAERLIGPIPPRDAAESSTFSDTP